MPKTIMADFTHQLIDRDYMFQTFMEGELWSSIENELTLEESRILWRQLGTIAKAIHGVEGEAFGVPLIGPLFPNWSQNVINWLESTLRDMKSVQLDVSGIQEVLEMVKANTVLLDEIKRPHLKHGDLWTFNVLVRRCEGREPEISAVLDSDRCTWGDPMADWTMFLLQVKDAKGAEAFWQTYGLPDQSPAARFRTLVYQIVAFGGASIDCYRQRKYERIQDIYREVRKIVNELHSIVG